MAHVRSNAEIRARTNYQRMRPAGPTSISALVARQPTCISTCSATRSTSTLSAGAVKTELCLPELCLPELIAWVRALVTQVWLVTYVTLAHAATILPRLRKSLAWRHAEPAFPSRLVVLAAPIKMHSVAFPMQLVTGNPIIHGQAAAQHGS